MDRSNEIALLAPSLQCWRDLWENPQHKYSMLDTQQIILFSCLTKGKNGGPTQRFIKALTKVAVYMQKQYNLYSKSHGKIFDRAHTYKISPAMLFILTSENEKKDDSNQWNNICDVSLWQCKQIL